VLRKIGLNLDEVRSQVMEYLGPDDRGHEPIVREPHVPLRRPKIRSVVSKEFDVTTELQDLLTQAAYQTGQTGDRTITVEHLLLVLLHKTDDWAIGMLRECGLDVGKALTEIEKHLGSDDI
jgi:ATP-dependent Clp protease ATP-binding subunit ClpA